VIVFVCFCACLRVRVCTGESVYVHLCVYEWLRRVLRVCVRECVREREKERMCVYVSEHAIVFVFIIIQLLNSLPGMSIQLMCICIYMYTYLRTLSFMHAPTHCRARFHKCREMRSL